VPPQALESAMLAVEIVGPLRIGEHQRIVAGEGRRPHRALDRFSYLGSGG
jgi:hypothetical protein